MAAAAAAAAVAQLGETRTHLGGDLASTNGGGDLASTNPFGDLASTNGGGGRGDEVEEKGEMDGGEEEEALLSPC